MTQELNVELGPDGKEWAKTTRAYEHVESVIRDAVNGPAGLVWYGHAVREAFVAGAEWQEARRVPSPSISEAMEWQPIDTAPKDERALFSLDWAYGVAPLNPPLFESRWATYALFFGKYGGWSAMYKAIGWMPAPEPLSATPSTPAGELTDV